MSPRTLMAGLGYAGLLPFYLAALWSLQGLPGTPFAVMVFLIYASVILAFLGGTLWGYAVVVAPPAKTTRLVLSNLVALFAAAAALLAVALPGATLPAVLLLAAGQLALLVWERSRGDCGGWYLRLRTRLTLGAMPAHLIMAIALTPSRAAFGNAMGGG